MTEERNLELIEIRRRMVSVNNVTIYFKRIYELLAFINECWVKKIQISKFDSISILLLYLIRWLIKFLMKIAQNGLNEMDGFSGWQNKKMQLRPSPLEPIFIMLPTAQAVTFVDLNIGGKIRSC